MKVRLTKRFPWFARAMTVLDTVYLKDPAGTQLEKIMARPDSLFPLVEHERIHKKQENECLFLPFFLQYGMEWLVKTVTEWGNAYRSISFEREAYANEGDTDEYKVTLFFADGVRFVVHDTCENYSTGRIMGNNYRISSMLVKHHGGVDHVKFEAQGVRGYVKDRKRFAWVRYIFRRWKEA